MTTEFLKICLAFLATRKCRLKLPQTRSSYINGADNMETSKEIANKNQ